MAFLPASDAAPHDSLKAPPRALEESRVPRVPGRTEHARSALGRAFGALAVLLLLGAAGPAPGGPSDEPSEYEIKAAFLYKFAQFTEWPEEAFDDEKSPFVIAVLGKDPFGEVLDKVVRNKRIGKRAIVVRRYKELEKLGTCHILFVPAAEARRMERLNKALHGKPILSVGESKGFASQGGMINFYIASKKVRFEINPAAARRADLRISAKLLKVARIVKDEDEEGDR